MVYFVNVEMHLMIFQIITGNGLDYSELIWRRKPMPICTIFLFDIAITRVSDSLHCQYPAPLHVASIAIIDFYGFLIL